LGRRGGDCADFSVWQALGEFRKIFKNGC